MMPFKLKIGTDRQQNKFFQDQDQNLSEAVQVCPSQEDVEKVGAENTAVPSK